jgi:hypothetical protein
MTLVHIVELGDGSSDGRNHRLLAHLVPLGPGGAQAVVGHHPLEQLLGRGVSAIWLCCRTQSLAPCWSLVERSGVWEVEDMAPAFWKSLGFVS